MRHKVVRVKNVVRLNQIMQALMGRAVGLPGMAAVEGATGAGKTTGAAWLRNRVDAVYVRAEALWTPTAMLGTILEELGGAASRQTAPMLQDIKARFRRTGRPLLLDEADYVVANGRLVETLRDIHDQTGVPVMLIGMTGLRKTIGGRAQLAGRIAQWVDFQPADLADTELLARELCEVTLAEDLLAIVHGETRGEVRLIVTALSRIEEFGQTRGLETVTAADWGDEPLFYAQGKAGRARRARVAEVPA